MRAILNHVTVILVIFLITAAMGCKKESSPTETPATITGDLFPIIEGHIYVYNEYETNAQGTKIPGTDYRIATKVGSSVTIAGKSGNILVDSIYTTNGQFFKLDTLITARKGTDGTIYFTLPQNMFQDFPVSLSLPLIWLPFFQPSAGVGTSYDIYSLDTTVTYQYTPDLSIPVRIQLTLSGVINQKENVNVPAGSYSAYRGELNYNLIATSGMFTSSQNGNILTMWLYENVGPVKIAWTPMGSDTTGTARELVSKNF